MPRHVLLLLTLPLSATSLALARSLQQTPPRDQGLQRECRRVEDLLKARRTSTGFAIASVVVGVIPIAGFGALPMGVLSLTMFAPEDLDALARRRNIGQTLAACETGTTTDDLERADRHAVPLALAGIALGAAWTVALTLLCGVHALRENE